MTGTYTDADVARHAKAIIDNKYPEEQAGPINKMISSLLMKDRVLDMDIDLDSEADRLYSSLSIEIKHMKES